MPLRLSLVVLGLVVVVTTAFRLQHTAAEAADSARADVVAPVRRRPLELPATIVNATVTRVPVVPQADHERTDLPAGLQQALAELDHEERVRAVEAALYAWAAVDLEAAAAWVKTQEAIPRAGAMAAVINGGASVDPGGARALVKRLATEDAEYADEYGAFLIVGLAQAGHFAEAAGWALDTGEVNIDWITSAYDRWALAKPEAALLDAVAIAEPTRRRAAADAAIGAWAKTDPKALAECAVNFPAGPEKNLAILAGLRAWAVNEPEKVSAWMIAHRDSIAAVPNLAVINED